MDRLDDTRGAALRVAIMTDETGWHTSRLHKALRARGAVGRCIDLADCRIDTTYAWHGLVIPGFGRELPDAVIVRGIAAGTFEQVTVRLGILHALAALGIAVYNSARGIERTVDKSMTSWLLHVAGVPTPPAWATESEAQARRTVMRETAAGHALVLKPLFGSQGHGLVRVGEVDGESTPLPDLGGFNHFAYLQRFIPAATAPGYDYRVMVVGGRAVAAMKRVSAHWIHNVAQGARCVATVLTNELAETAERAAAALQLDYAGVDLLPDPADARKLWVIEVNGVAAWRGLQRVTPFDIAQCLVDDLIDRCVAAQRGHARRSQA